MDQQHRPFARGWKAMTLSLMAGISLLGRRATRQRWTNRRRASTRALTFMGACLTVTAAHAVDRTWDNGNGTLLWSQGNNWSGNVEPFVADRAIFPSTIPSGNGNIALSSGEGASELLIETGGYTLAGGTLHVAGGFVTVTSGNSTIASPISSDGTSGLTKLGFGVLNLQGLNTYSGDTFVSEGLLDVSGASDRIPDTSTVILDPGTQFRFFSNMFTETIGGLEGSGSVAFGHNNSLGTTLTLGHSSSTTERHFSGNMTEFAGSMGTLIKKGPYTQVFSGTLAYVGRTIIDQGTLTVSNPATNTLPDTAEIQIGAGGTFGIGTSTTETVAALSGTGNTTVGTAATLIVASDPLLAGNSAFSGNMTGNGNFTKTSSNTLTYPGAMNIGGKVDVQQGTFTVPSTGSITAGNFQLDSDATLNLNGGTITTTNFDFKAASTLSHTDGTIRVTGGAFTHDFIQQFFINGSGNPTIELKDGGTWVGTPSNVNVGESLGPGALNIIDTVLGPSPETLAEFFFLSVGQATGSAGSSALVSGDNAVLKPQFLDVGGFGSNFGGTLTVENGGTVDTNNSRINLRENGTINLLDGNIITRTFETVGATGVLNHAGGTLTVRGNGLSTPGTPGTYEIGGANSPAIRIEDGATWDAGPRRIGIENVGPGSLTILDTDPDDADPTAVTVPNITEIGSHTASGGSVLTVSGQEASFTAHGLDVGGLATGTLNIESGGRVLTTSSSIRVRSGGTVNLTEGNLTTKGFILDDDPTAVFNHAGGTLTVQDGSLSRPAGGYIIQGTTGTATVQLVGAAASNIDGNITVGSTGKLILDAAYDLTGNALRVTSGDLEIRGGASYAGGDVQFFGGGGLTTVSVDGLHSRVDANVNIAIGFGTEASQATLSNGATLAADFNIFTGPSGRLEGIGTLQPGSEFFNDGTLAPGLSAGSIVIEGNARLNSSGTLEIQLGGLTAGILFDQLVVTGDAMLGGTIDVSLISLFTPSVGQSFEIVDVGGSLSGTFSGLAQGATVGNFGGLDLLIDYTAGDGNDVALVAVSGLAGDYNNDGFVDAADYTVWRDNLGALAGTLLNDSVGGVIGEDQYNTWSANFGLSVPGSGSLSDAPVPEPASAILMIVASTIVWGRHRTRRVWIV